MKNNVLAMCLCIVAMVVTGCSSTPSIIGIATEGLALFAPDGKKKVDNNFIFKPGIDTKETIIHKLGQPHNIIIIDTNKQVLAYGKYIMADLYALKNGVYQNSYLTTNEVAKSFSKNDFIQIFPCFQETVTYKTPPVPASTSSSIPTTSFAPAIVPASY